MNLDEFLVPSSVESPAGLVAPAPIEYVESGRYAQRANIPMLKSTKSQKQSTTTAPPASMPRNMTHRARNGEFDYVQRRVRKTSIDERMVCYWNHFLFVIGHR